METQTKCPKCSREAVKNGKVKGKQRWLCKKCNFQFTRFTPRGKNPLIKLLAVLLYLSGMSMNSIGFLLKVSTPTVLYWIRNFAYENIEGIKPEKIAVVELDEMWHYIKEKKPSCGYGKQEYREVGCVAMWE